MRSKVALISNSKWTLLSCWIRRLTQHQQQHLSHLIHHRQGTIRRHLTVKPGVPRASEVGLKAEISFCGWKQKNRDGEQHKEIGQSGSHGHWGLYYVLKLILFYPLTISCLMKLKQIKAHWPTEENYKKKSWKWWEKSTAMTTPQLSRVMLLRKAIPAVHSGSWESNLVLSCPDGSSC
jgi:hypothetical protein